MSGPQIDSHVVNTTGVNVVSGTAVFVNVGVEVGVEVLLLVLVAEVVAVLVLVSSGVAVEVCVGVSVGVFVGVWVLVAVGVVDGVVLGTHVLVTPAVLVGFGHGPPQACVSPVVTANTPATTTAATTKPVINFFILSTYS